MSYYCRPRRRSGSSIVVLDGDLDPVKKPPDELDDSLDYNMVMMLAGDNGPHREMAVDVPDTFIARNKTPPRYPPPKPKLQVSLSKKLVDDDTKRFSNAQRPEIAFPLNKRPKRKGCQTLHTKVVITTVRRFNCSRKKILVFY